MIRLCELPQVPEVFEAADNVLRSGKYVKGELSKEFAAKWAEKCGMKYGISVGSGAQALELAIKAVFEANKEVSYNHQTYQAVPNAIRRTGNIALPRESGKVDIFAHHLHNEDLNYIPKLEDCSHCHGYKPKAETAIFSLFPTKILGACGEAGVIVTNNEKVKEECEFFASHGEPTGTNARMDEIQAAILLAKLPYLDRRIYRRQEIVNIYDTALGIFTLGQFHYMYCINGDQKTVDKLISKGIESKLVYNEPYVALPFYPEITPEDIVDVIQAVIEIRREI
jgi:dTDP-4-amino-4,6-dideoxygalactose transaminase